MCTGILKACFCLILIYIESAGLIYGVQPSFLLIVVCHDPVFSGLVMDRLGCLHQRIPCPGIIRIRYTGLVKNVFIIDQRYCIHIFWNAVNLVLIGEVLNQILSKIVGIILFSLIIQIRQICQDSRFRIFAELICVHPENIRKGIAVCHCLQLCPVFTPCRYLHIYGHIWVLFVISLCQCLHTCLLVDLPAQHGELHFFVGRGSACICLCPFIRISL